MEVLFVKKPYGVLMPCYAQDVDNMARIKNGSTVRANVCMPRNIFFHRKFFALLDVGYTYWEPPLYQGNPVQKNPERYRKDVTILAGRSHVVPRVDGSFTVEADSISFANMPQDEFENLYNGAIEVLRDQILTDWTRNDVLLAAREINSFAG